MASNGGIPPALADPRTVVALRRFRREAGRSFLLGLASFAGGIVAVSSDPNSEPEGLAKALAFLGIAIGFVAWATALIAIGRSIRMRRVLGRTPWVERRGTYRVVPFGRSVLGALATSAATGGDDRLYIVSTTRWRARRLPQGRDLLLLMASNATGRWMVVASPDIEDLLVAKSVRSSWMRRSVRRATSPPGGSTDSPL